MLNRINYSLLKRQKLTVIALLNKEESEYHKDHLEGLLSMIDAIQDHAVNVLGLEEEEVFNL